MICAVSASSWAAVDELGYVPKHWNRFIVGARQLGETALTWSANPSVFVDSDIEGSKCAIGPDTGNGGSCSGIAFGSGDWTVVVKGRMDPTVGSMLLCLGNPMGTGGSDSSVSLTYEGDGKVCVSLCTNGGAGDRSTANKYDVPDATEVFHTYALQFTRSSKMLALWVDGVKKGEFSRDMAAKNYSTFTFFGTPTKTKGKTTFALGATTMTSAVSNFRVYQRLLTACEMKTLANPPLDEIGYRPAAWYPLNGSLNAEAAGFLPAMSIAQAASTVSYGAGRDGIPGTAAADGSLLYGTGVPWGADTGVAGGDWTVVLDMKGEDRADAVYFGTGNGSVSRCFALVSGGAGKVKLVKYSGSSNYATAFVVNVPDASSAFHQYAIVRSGADIRLYVDGVLSGTETRDNPADNMFTLLKAPGGNGVNGLYNAASSVVDDFRVYKRALTGAELDAIRSASRDELGSTPTHWYKFDGTLSPSGRRELGFEGAFADAVFEGSGEDKALAADGDKPAGTNIAWRAGNWTVLVKARTADADNSVVASFGSSLSTDLHSLALASAGPGLVSLSGFGEGLAHADLVTATVPDASSEFHTYAIVRDGDNVSFWVDAVCAGTVERPNDPTFNGFSFFSIHDGIGASGFVEPVSGAAISDFRVYDRALDMREQLAISGNPAVAVTASWTGTGGDGLVSTPENWACTNMFGAEIPGGVPCRLTDVSFSGSVAAQIPAGTEWEYKSIVFDCTLSDDCDWRGLAGTSIEGTVDVAGNELTLTSLAGGGTVTDSLGGGSLRLYVGDGATVTGDSGTLSLSGRLKLVKDGPGTYVATKAQTYSGGAEIAAGYAKFGASGSVLPFGAASSTIAVASGAELDANGYLNQYVYNVRLDGGVLANRGANVPMGSPGFGNVSLTADSSFYCTGSMSLRAANSAAIVLDLGGRTLTATVKGDVLFRLYNCDVTAGRVVCAAEGSTGVPMLNLSDGVRAASTDFDLDLGLVPYADSTVRNLTFRKGCYYQQTTPGTARVFGTFTTYTDLFQNVEMQDGSTISLSNWTGAFSTVNAEHSDRVVTFAQGASVTVDLAGRKDLETVVDSGSPYVLTWNSMPDADFTLDSTSAEIYRTAKDENGLKLLRKMGLVLSVR